MFNLFSNFAPSCQSWQKYSTRAAVLRIAMTSAFSNNGCAKMWSAYEWSLKPAEALHSAFATTAAQLCFALYTAAAVVLYCSPLDKLFFFSEDKKNCAVEHTRASGWGVQACSSIWDFTRSRRTSDMSCRGHPTQLICILIFICQHTKKNNIAG